MDKKKYWDNSDLHKEHIEAGPVSRWQAQQGLVGQALSQITINRLEQEKALRYGKLD